MGEQPRQGQLDLAGAGLSDSAGRFEEDGTRPAPVGESQPGLFPDNSVPDELVGYRGPSACQIAGITYRQLDYWARTSLVVPSIWYENTPLVIYNALAAGCPLVVTNLGGMAEPLRDAILAVSGKLDLLGPMRMVFPPRVAK